MSTTTRQYHISGLHCADCAATVQAGVGKLDGVTRAAVDHASGLLTVDGGAPLEAIAARVRTLGYELVIDTPDDAPPPARGGVAGFWGYLLRDRASRFAVGGGALILISIMMTLIGLGAAADAVFVTATAIALYPVARSALTSLAISRTITINLLMTIAAVGALVLGEYAEAAVVVLLFAIGEALEGYTAERARAGIRALMQIAPERAVRVGAAGDDEVPVAALALGDRLRVRAGDRIPMDGVVESGASEVDQAPITGESVPVAKTVGDEVYAGTINGLGSLIVRVTRRADDSTVARIVHMVEAAQAHKSPTERQINAFARWYTPAVVIGALAVATLPPLLGGAPLWDSVSGHGSLYHALTMLVIACPCALVISAPVTIISAITRAARMGVLIKGGAHLEALAGVTVAAFDKTGTLTHARPAVTTVVSTACETSMPCPHCDEVLALAAAVEHGSAHPVAHAVIAAAEARGVGTRYASADAVQTLIGRGVTGVVAAHPVTVGSHAYFDRDYPHDPALCALADAAEAAGQTTLMVARDQAVIGCISVIDQPRPEGAAVLADLRALGLRTIMLTGDHQRVAEAIAARVGVDRVQAGLLPEDKVEIVRALAAQGEAVAMIGDGINDTPALAAAAVGVAMGGAGSRQAMETADITLLSADLRGLPAAIRLARHTRRLIRQNIALSLTVKAAFLTLAALGAADMWLAIVADVGMLLLVTLNGLRPLRGGRRVG